MNLTVTDLKVTKVVPAVVEWNGKEIESFLQNALEEYNNLVVTEDTVKDSKKTMADLNKLADKIDNFRKDTKNKLSVNIKPFEQQAKSIFAMIKEARESIDRQVKHHEDKIKEEKKENVMHRVDALQHEYDLWPEFLEQVEVKESYYNLSTTLNKAEEALREQFEYLKQAQNMKQQKIDTIKVIVETFNNQLKFKFMAEEFDYLLERDISEISRIVNEKVQGRLEQQKIELERIEKEKQEAIERAKFEAEEAERKKAQLAREEEEKRHREEIQAREREEQDRLKKLQEEQARVLESVSKSIERTVPVESKSNKRTVVLEINATKEQMGALKNYMDQYNIEYKRL